MSQKRLFLLDAYALIYRAYYGMIRAPRITSTGLNTSAIFGFCNTLDEVLRKENPTHIAVCFDPPHGRTFRHDKYPDYKAGRDEQPEGITLAIPYIKRILAAYNIPVLEVTGYEADDIIGTLSRMAEAEGFDTYMMTPDKDFGQLVTDHVWQYRPSLRGEGFEVRGPKEVCERYGISSTSQVIDLLALEGDKSDNIPGCPGVGQKMAQKLISDWGNVENMLAHSSEIKGALGQKVRDNAEQIRFSHWLATIRTDVPLDVTPEQLVRMPENTEALVEVYRELEFRTFLKRLGADLAPKIGAEGVSAFAQTPADEGSMGSLFDFMDEPKQVAEPMSAEPPVIATEPVEAGGIVSEAAAQPSVGCEVYAVGAEAMTATLQGIALAWPEGTTGRYRRCYIALPQGGTLRQELLQVVAPLFSQGTVEVVSHDIKRAYLLLLREQITWGTRYYDTSVAHYILEPEMNHRLPNLALRYLGLSISEGADTARSSKPEPLPRQEAAAAMCERAEVSLRLREVFDAKLRELDQLPLLEDIELPLVRVLADMEYNGVRIDVEALNRLAEVYRRRIAELEQEAYTLAGRTFNVASPSQVGELLFGEMKIDPKAKKTKKGAYSTTEEILEKYRAQVPLVDVILKIRGARKLLTTYIEALPKMVSATDGKIHTTFNQTITATGRISSANPNLQNIPIRTDDGREIRRMFIADPGCLILSADYSQIELRLIADLSADKDMVEAFLSGEDIHRATAAKIYGLPVDKVTDSMRRNAKTANFGIIYGISAFGLSERLGIPRSEAKQLIDGYFTSYPHIKEYIDSAIEQARQSGYVTTIKGRKRYLPDINSRNAVVRAYAERNAINAPIQGSAADIIKIAMINIHRAMAQRGLRSKMILQVHDELVFNVEPDELAELQQLVTEQMEAAYSGRVPFEVSSGVGTNWLEAH